MLMNNKKLNKKLINIFFSNLPNSIFTFFIVFILILSTFNTLKWIFISANWEVVTSNLSLYIYGNYPEIEIWRPAIWILSLFFLSIITLLGSRLKSIRRNILLGWICTIPLGLYLLYGGIGLTPVLSRNFGGLTLTIFLTVCSAILSLPIGIILAFCRQSSLPVINKLSSIYIDAMRSVPLIAVLFFGQLLIPLFLPLGVEIDRVWRAILSFTLFVSAYIAEDIRGGLQSIPLRQIEAANSLGLSQFQIIWFVLIPQSLRIALPALTNQCIGLFQNTSLMAILGLVELLGIGRSILANPKFISQYIEVYVWLACVYWVVCTIMAVLARYIEKRWAIT